MHLTWIPRGMFSLLLLASLYLSLAHAHTYFIITAPSQGAQLVNGAANRITWTKGLLDDIDAFDIEMSRLSVDGLILVARDVPASPGSVNLFFQDVPPADDYYLLFLNSTSGMMFTTSSRFSIASSSSSSNGTSTSPDPDAPTVTVSGGPNPLSDFATTFPPSANAAIRLGWKAVRGQVWAVGLSVDVAVLGGVFTVL